MTNDTYTPPNPYATDLTKLRAAESTPESQFAERWAAERRKELEAEADEEHRFAALVATSAADIATEGDEETR